MSRYFVIPHSYKYIYFPLPFSPSPSFPLSSPPPFPSLPSLPLPSLSWGLVLGDGVSVGGSSSYSSGVSRLASRSRMLLRRRGNGRGLSSRWPLVPASDVPDSLVNQVRGHMLCHVTSCDCHCLVPRQWQFFRGSPVRQSSGSSRGRWVGQLPGHVLLASHGPLSPSLPILSFPPSSCHFFPSSLSS